MEKRVHKNLISLFLLLGVLTLGIFGIISYMQYSRLSQTYNGVIESYQTIRAANQSLISIDEAAISVSSFLQTNDAETLKQIPLLISAAEVNFETLKQLVKDNQIQTDYIKKLTPLFYEKIMFLNKIITEHSAGHASQAILIASDKYRLKLTDEISRLIIEIKQEEMKQLYNSSVNLEAYKVKARRLMLSTGILSAFLFLYCFVLLDKYLKRY